MTLYDRILVPTDGSAEGKRAVAHALDLASVHGADVHTLYVVDTDAVAYGLGAEQVDRLQQGKFGEMTELREEAESATQFVHDLAEENGVDVVEHHAGGQPHQVIANHAEDNDIDLIVMGSHGRSGVRRALLGSVTERTLRSTHTPVLVVDYQDVE